MINLCIVDGQPRVLSLKGLLEAHLSHRRRMVTKRTEFDLRKATERLHLLEGFLTAIDHIDEVIKIIRRSQDVPAAEQSLMGKFLLSVEQAKAILDMRLARLTALERETVQKEIAEKEALIRRLKEILGSPKELDLLIGEELTQLKETFGDARRTRIVPEFTERTLEDLIPDTDVVVLVTRDGYIKRLPLDQYRRQRRGGRGLVQMETKEEDYVIQTFATRTHDNVLFFTTLGRVYLLKAYELPEGSRHSKGKAVINLLPKLKEHEKVQTLLPLRDMATEGGLLFASRKGLVKRTGLDMFQNIRTNGIQAVLLEEGDELVDVALVAPEDKEAILATHSGQLVRFPIAEVREMGRSTYGVIGARLSDPKADYIVTMAPVRGERPFLLTITSTGFGKRSLDHRLPGDQAGREGGPDDPDRRAKRRGRRRPPGRRERRDPRHHPPRDHDPDGGRGDPGPGTEHDGGPGDAARRGGRGQGRARAPRGARRRRRGEARGRPAGRETRAGRPSRTGDRRRSGRRRTGRRPRRGRRRRGGGRRCGDARSVRRSRSAPSASRTGSSSRPG